MVNGGPGNGILDRKRASEPFLEVWGPDSYRTVSIFQYCGDFSRSLKSRCFEPERMVGPLARVLVFSLTILLCMSGILTCHIFVVVKHLTHVSNCEYFSVHQGGLVLWYFPVNYTNQLHQLTV